MKTNKKPMTAVAEIADRTAYSALKINDHLDNNRPYSPMFVATAPLAPFSWLAVYIIGVA